MLLVVHAKAMGMMWYVLLIIFVIINLNSARGTTAFQFPTFKFVGLPSGDASNNAPNILVRNGPKYAAELKKKFEIYCKDISAEANNSLICWEPYLRESYEVAEAIFLEIAQVTRHRQEIDHQSTVPSIQQLFLSFPSMKRPENLVHISKVLQSDICKRLLGLEDASAELFPSSPAPYIRIKFNALTAYKDETQHDQRVPRPTDSATADTTDWVNNFLGKYRLCPYTYSVSRAAVGLSSVGVPIGGVHVRAECTNSKYIYDATSYNISKASELVAIFWSEVVTLMNNSTQEEWATSLLVFPEYDLEFDTFIEVCDGIIEPTVVATQSTDFIGRAWFHPLYDADAIGHSEVIAGHAVPHKMVEGFMESLLSGHDVVLEYDELARANNKVRQTPHATINILRRNQLLAAAEYEKGLGTKKPKANSVYVYNTLRLSKALISRDTS